MNTNIILQRSLRHGWIRNFVKWGEQHQALLVWVILLASVTPFLSVIDDRPQQDVVLYRSIAADIARGVLPYRDRVVEYPPYAIPIFLIPATVKEWGDYSTTFKLFALLPDLLIKCLLLTIGLKEARGLRALLPMAFYCIAAPFLKHFYLQRYDVFAALISLLAIYAFTLRHYAISGVLVAVGACVKLYPALWTPILLILAWRVQKSRAFAAGLVIGAVPLLLAGFWLPWWRFLAYHEARGLQVESLYASILWLVHFAGFGVYEWTSGHGCMELHGATVDHILPWAKMCFVVAVVVSTAFTCVQALQTSNHTLPYLAQLMLFPLLAFVIFNQVFSPQYLIWLLPLAGMVLLTGPWLSVALLVAAFLTPIVYPSKSYDIGLRPFETIVLVVRNLLLLGVWVSFFKSLHRRGPSGPPAYVNT